LPRGNNKILNFCSILIVDSEDNHLYIIATLTQIIKDMLPNDTRMSC